MAGEHHPSQAHPSDKTLWAGAILILVFAAIEAIAGWWAGSLALLGDAGHMLTDATALTLAALAVWVGRQPPSTRHSFGLVRAEVVAALINGLFMLVVVASIVFHAIGRLLSPQPVGAMTVMVVATIGLIVNIIVALILHRGVSNLNTRAALLHVMGDLLGSVAALLAGIVIYFTGWLPIDPLLSLVICALILYSSLHLLRDVFHVIMEGVPPYLDLAEVGSAISGVAGIVSVHDLHIWTLASGHVALSAHMVLQDMGQWQGVLDSVRSMLSDRYGIDHVTLQPVATDNAGNTVLCESIGTEKSV